jgi:hypothetical protein
MKTEWMDLTNIEDVARAKVEGWEIEIDTGPYWEAWTGKAWMEYMSYRGRPAQPKTKIITLRKALFLSGPIGYWTTECDEKYSEASYFIKWIGEPYDVEVPE